MKSKRTYQSAYSFTKGIDLVSSPDEVNPERSPDAVNVIYAKQGYMEKRPGYRTIHKFSAQINGIFYFQLGVSQMIIVHAGTAIYKLRQNQEPEELMTDLADSKSTGFSLGGKLYILTGREYIYYDGEIADHVKKIATVPTYMIACKPNGVGVYYQSPNYLQPKRLVKFSGDGTSTTFKLPEENISEVNSVHIDGVANAEYSVDIAKGTVAFVSAPPTAKVVGEDNVDILYTKLSAGDSSRIEQSRLSILYGIGANDRAIVGGNPAFIGRDWISELRDPTYFPYELESVVGGDTMPIMGYGKLGDKLCIAKRSAGGESTIFFRTGAVVEDRAVFSTRQSIVGVGMVCMGNMGSIDDEPMFLSESGIYGIAASSLTADSTVQNRSFFINPALVEEKNLAEASLISIGNRLYTAVGDRVYVLDGSLGRTSLRGSDADYVYECFIWQGIPVRQWFALENRLYFGTEDGRLCMFKDSSYGQEQFNDDGRAISAHIATKADSDGNYTVTKQLERRGLYLRLKGYNHTGVAVQLRADYGDTQQIYDFVRLGTEFDELDFARCGFSSISDIYTLPINARCKNYCTYDFVRLGTEFDELDFARCGFSSISDIYTLPINARCKNYCTLQVVLKNDEVNQGLGLLGILKKYSYRRAVRMVE